ncbi:hypothetical protein AB0C34_17665 [Nocardia sp. NPDC049220]|uniref:hypothetical protein n=1 Tax=Nocardia sp. NPDC049220 TaxID=3155273 RepID=UPI0033E52A3F
MPYSRINLVPLNSAEHPARTIHCGWDHGLQTFYAAVIDPALTEHDKPRVLVESGREPGELVNAQQVIDLVSPYAVIPGGLSAVLDSHRAADTSSPDSLAQEPGHQILVSMGMLTPAVVATRFTARTSPWPTLDAQVDYLLIEPDGTSTYGSREADQTLLEALSLRIPGFVVPKDHGELCLWFDDTFASTDTPQMANPRADYVVTNLGFPHAGWRGTVAVSMNCDEIGETPPLTREWRGRIDQLIEQAHPGLATAAANLDALSAVARGHDYTATPSSEHLAAGESRDAVGINPETQTEATEPTTGL